MKVFLAKLRAKVDFPEALTPNTTIFVPSLLISILFFMALFQFGFLFSFDRVPRFFGYF